MSTMWVRETYDKLFIRLQSRGQNRTSTQHRRIIQSQDRRTTKRPVSTGEVRGGGQWATAWRCGVYQLNRNV